MMLFLFIFVLLFTGFFAGIEIAYASANKLSIGLKKKQGKRSGRIISQLQEHPSQFIGITLVGFNIFLVAYGLIVSQMLLPLWHYAGLSKLDEAGIGKLIFDILVAAGIVLLTEFVFKAIFRAKNDELLSFFADIISFFYSLLQPVARFFISVTVWILKYIFNVHIADQKHPFNRMELEHYLIQTKEYDESVSELNQELFENALSLPGTKVRNCLVPRREIVAIDLSTPVSQVVQKMIETKLSRLVVFDGNIDNIVGYVHQLDMFKNPQSLQSILLPITTVPETMSVTDLINKLSKEHKSVAWIVDEFGGTAGIVTMEDLLEEIFGEILDEHDTEEFVEKQISETEYVFSGRLELDYLNEKYRLHFPEGSSDTLSGYVTQQFEHFPKQGDRTIASNYQFDVLSMGDTRIELIKVKWLK